MSKFSSKPARLIALLVSVTLASCSQVDDPPFRVLQLFDHGQPETLGLPWAPGAGTYTIFSPGEDDNRYNHGVVLFPFKGMLYAQWQSSAADEDADDTQVFYSRSADGENWEKPSPLTANTGPGIRTSGGWWSDGKTLVAYINVWPQTKNRVRVGLTEYVTSVDGITWSRPRDVKDNYGQPVRGIIEQDVHAMPGGRLITAFHIQPGLVATPFYTDDPLGITGWTPGEMRHLPSSDPSVSRELEPSWFFRSDGAVVMIFRDQQGTFRKLASVSRDNGLTWTTPVVVDTPDSRSKQSAGNLPDGTAFMVNNPSGSRSRWPLVITLSSDGFLFDRAYLLRSGGKDLQPLRYPGKYKSKGYSYPKSVIWGDYLYVSYATNKEDVELTRIKLDFDLKAK